MSCICTNILNLGSTGTCIGDTIDFGTKSKNDGIHKMKLTFLGTTFIVEETFSVDDQLKFPTKDLNENYTYTAEIFEPDGDKIVILKNGVNYDCFTFETRLQYVA